MKTPRQKIITKLDKLFSQKVRSKGFCERCGKESNLQCAHIYSRRNKRLRWDFENALCLCAGCHLYWWHLEPAEAVRWAMTFKNFEHLDKVMQDNKPMKIFELEQLLNTLLINNK